MIGLGQMGLTLEGLYWMNPREFANAQKGYYKRETQLERSQWERTRWQTVLIINPHLKKPYKNPKSLVVFPWEKEEGPNLIEKLKVMDGHPAFPKVLPEKN